MKYTVSKLNEEIKEKLERFDEFKSICVEGEISNFTVRGPHIYFEIKDTTSLIPCVFFNYSRILKSINEFKIGDKVDIYGSITVYKNQCRVQFLTSYIKHQNTMGDKMMALEKLKEELKNKGYFDKERKRKIPKHINKLGVVTSKDGAAIADILKTKEIRNKNVDIYLFDAKVQGELAPFEIAKGIEKLNEIDEIQVIIVGRGGGSYEDLYCFNDRLVLDAIYNSKKPIVSAVGHETDILLSDLVADLSASTPTQSIEKIIFDRNVIDYDLKDDKRYLKNKVNEYLEYNKNRINDVYNNYYIKNMSTIIKNEIKKLDNNKLKLVNHIIPVITENKFLLKEYKNKILENFKYNITENNKTLKNIKLNLKSILNNKIKNERNIVEKSMISLNSYSHNKILERGYTISTNENGDIIKSIKEIKKGENIKNIYIDGYLISNVIKKSSKRGKNEKK